MQVIPAPFTKLAAAIEEIQAGAAARELARRDLDSETGAADYEAETRFETEQREITLNSEFLQCAAFLQAMPKLGVPLQIFEFADLYRSMEAEAFIEAAEGHEILESEEVPTPRMRVLV